jgi:predicted RNA-binding protein YlqC (UPF0109 family)
MKDFVTTILRAFVDHPGDLRLTDLDGERTHLIELRCHPEDIGKIIGKSGKTIGAIRVLANALAAKSGRRILLEVVE